MLITTGGLAEIPNAPSNVFIAKYAPGDALMAVSDVVVSHGGNGTVYQALSCGVPVIGFPTMFDQEINMRQVEALGIGVQMSNKDYTGSGARSRGPQGHQRNALSRALQAACRAHLAHGRAPPRRPAHPRLLAAHGPEGAPGHRDGHLAAPAASQRGECRSMNPLRLFAVGGESTGIPFDMFESTYPEAEARRARRMENIYHVGQAKIWDGRDVLAQLIAKHGKPELAPEKRRSLARVFSIIMWGELAAWKISAQLADRLVPLEAKLAAASQVHDEALHIPRDDDYLEALGEKPGKLEFFASGSSSGPSRPTTC